MPFEIDISNHQSVLPLPTDVLRQTLLTALHAEQVASAVLSISIVDNATIHRLNREHLQHDYPTDVISFALEMLDADDDWGDWDEDDSEQAGAEQDELAAEAVVATAADAPPSPAAAVPSAGGLRAAGTVIEGEIVASAEMACDMAAAGQWSAISELQLYLVHGLLHLCGYDDLTPAEQQVMRERERAILSQLGLTAVYAEDHEQPSAAGD